MSKQILLISDMAGYGKVALSAMIPVLSHMKHHLYNLPTALVSNTFDYGKLDILETTDYMINTVNIWNELGFSFDAISTGFIASERQAKFVADFCKEQKAKGATVFVDPIMGDEGALYNGVSEKTVSHMKELIGVADYIVPNYTEALCLVGEEYKEVGLTMSEVDSLLDKLLAMGAKSIIITSSVVEKQEAVIVYDYSCKQRTILPFESVPIIFPGTGDIFSSVFMGTILEGNGIIESVQRAMDVTKEMIILNKDNVDRYKGIQIEECLEVIDR